MKLETHQCLFNINTIISHDCHRCFVGTCVALVCVGDCARISVVSVMENVILLDGNAYMLWFWYGQVGGDRSAARSQ